MFIPIIVDALDVRIGSRSDGAILQNYVALKPKITVNSASGDIWIMVRNTSPGRVVFCKWKWGFVSRAKNSLGKVVGCDNDLKGYLPNVLPYDWIELEPGESFQFHTWLLDQNCRKVARFKRGWTLFFKMTKAAESETPPDAIGPAEKFDIVKLSPAFLKVK